MTSEDWDMLPDVEDLEKIVNRELKKLEEFEKQMENMKKEVKPMTKEEEYRNADVPMPDERGPNDLEQRIEDLMRISLSHQNLNADLRKEVMFYKKKCEHFEYMYNQLKKEKEELHSKGQSMLNEFRNKGDV